MKLDVNNRIRLAPCGLYEYIRLLMVLILCILGYEITCHYISKYPSWSVKNNTFQIAES